MEAARLKRARRRMRANFIGSGVLLAFFFLYLAALVISLVGLEPTGYILTLIFAAGVMAGGAYAIVLFGSILVHAVRRLVVRQPIMDSEN